MIMAMGVPMIVFVAFALAMLVMAMVAKMATINVDAAVEIRVGFANKRPTYRLAGIAERDGERSLAAHDLRHAPDVAAAETG